MKKINHTIASGMLLVLLALTAIGMISCEKDSSHAPVIQEIRNYATSPYDTIVNVVHPKQWIVLQGRYLNTVSKVTFCGVPATIKSALFTDENLVVEIPEIDYKTVAPNDLNWIEATNEDGVTRYQIAIIGKPYIRRVRNFADSPNDTILAAVLPGQKINIIGTNLQNPTQIAFLGVNVDLSQVQYTDSSTIVQVPSDLSESNDALANTISYASKIGTDSYTIRIFGSPVILSVSNEVPHPGDTVYLYGKYLYFINSLTFAETPITSYTESTDGRSVKFVCPELTHAGPVEIVTASGTFTSVYNVNDLVTGILSDFEPDKNWNVNWEWWGGASREKDEPEFKGGTGYYLKLKIDILTSGEGYSWNTAIRIPNTQWLPEENLEDPVKNWALKFEMNIPNVWDSGSLCIVTGNTNFMVRFEPWKNTAGYKTKGWETVTIPLNTFRKKSDTFGDGYGDPVETLKILLGAKGKSVLQLYLHNYEATNTNTEFLGAFDNFRVVKQ